MLPTSKQDLTVENIGLLIVVAICSIPVTRDPYIVVAYFAIIYPLRLWCLSRAQPFVIPKFVMVLYNVVQVALSLYIVIGILASSGVTWLVRGGIQVPDNSTLRAMVWLHYYNKWLDLLDTVFIVLRKSWRQLSFLHVFHHATIGPVWYLVLTTPITSGSYAFGAFMNSVVHAVMYTHYLVTALGIRNPFKAYVTIVQMSQFAICLLLSVTGIFTDYDNIPPWLCLLQTTYMLSMLYLFKRQVIDARKTEKREKSEKPGKECKQDTSRAPKKMGSLGMLAAVASN